jgi:hypothetical protein
MFVWTFFKYIFLKIHVNYGILSMRSLFQTIKGFLQLIYFAFIIDFNLSKWLFNIDLFFLESHSKMMHLHQGDRSFIYIVQLVRSLVWLSPNELQEQIILQDQYLLSVCSLFTTNLVLYLCTSHFAFFFVL